MSDKHETSEDQVVDRRRMLGLTTGGVALVGAALAAGLQEEADASGSLVVDVAIDGATEVFNRIVGDVTQIPTRGATLIVSGRIYPRGTIERGLDDPNQIGSIGRWHCRGVILSRPDDEPPTPPFFFTTQYFDFGPGSSIITEGPEGGQITTRVIVGGTGRYLRATGTCREEEKGPNNSQIDLGPFQIPSSNLRFTFRFT